jgi:GT2 family glycosyltransferase
MDTAGKGAKSVCVVIVNYNGGATLTECVRSLLASTVPVGIVVSDNGSQDDSIAYLRASVTDAPRLSIVENWENLGFAKANNDALARCRNDYVLVLNPDCIVEPDTLERMIEVMEQHPEAGMGSCLIVNPDGSEQAGCRRFVPTPWRSMVRVLHLHRVIRNQPRFRSFTMTDLPLPRTPVEVEAISGAFMFVRREALEPVGLMDESYFLHCEDLDWCMRFRQAGWKILFVPQVRVVHWKGLSSKAHPVVCEYHKHCGMVRFYNKFFRHQYPGALMALVVLAVWLRFFAKSGWIMVRKLFSMRHSSRGATPFPVQQAQAGPDEKQVVTSA